MNTHGSFVDTQAQEGRLTEWIRRLGVEPKGAITSEALTRELETRGFDGWLAESFAVSLEASGRLRGFWQELARSSHGRDRVFALGDAWGCLVSIESLIESCVAGRGEQSAQWRQQVAALLTSVVALEGALAQLAARRQISPISPIRVTTATLTAAEEALLSA